MILAHRDSHGNAWYFRFKANRATVARIARKLFNKAVRVERAQAAGNSDELARALVDESVTLADYQAYNTASVEEWDAAPTAERFII